MPPPSTTVCVFVFISPPASSLPARSSRSVGLQSLSLSGSGQSGYRHCTSLVSLVTVTPLGLASLVTVTALGLVNLVTDTALGLASLVTVTAPGLVSLVTVPALSLVSLVTVTALSLLSLVTVTALGLASLVTQSLHQVWPVGYSHCTRSGQSGYRQSLHLVWPVWLQSLH